MPWYGMVWRSRVWYGKAQYGMEGRKAWSLAMHMSASASAWLFSGFLIEMGRAYGGHGAGPESEPEEVDSG